MSLNKSSPPHTMTWGRALPMLVLCGVFDGVRAFFSLFWFFGPAIAALYCTSSVNSVAGTSVAESAGKVTGALCTTAAVKAGAVLSPALVTFGIIMAMAVGLLGWMTVYVRLLTHNPKIFKVGGGSVLTLLLGLCLAELPFLSALPSLTLSVGRLYRAQIKREKAELKEWEQEQAALQQQQSGQQIAYRRAYQERMVSEATYAEQLTDEEIPEGAATAT